MLPFLLLLLKRLRQLFLLPQWSQIKCFALIHKCYISASSLNSILIYLYVLSRLGAILFIP